jgi:hypothetical protein
MSTRDDNTEIADRFGVVAKQFCSIVDSASSLERADLLVKTYRILPALIGEAIGLPDVKLDDSDNQVEGMSTPASGVNVRLSSHEWDQLYNLLKEKLGGWNLYRQVFDPIEDKEAICGSLAEDIADIYRDLREGLVLKETHQAPPEDIIWEWRFSFYSHWGRHAMDALQTIHSRLQGILY